MGRGVRAMMGRQQQSKLFYQFRLEDRIPTNHLLRRIDVVVTAALADLHKELAPYYSDIGRPSVDPELMIRMLIVGCCCGIRSSAGSPRKSNCTSPIAGSAGSIWKTRSRTTRRSRPTDWAAFARVICCATSSSASSGRQWPWGS